MKQFYRNELITLAPNGEATWNGTTFTTLAAAKAAIDFNQDEYYQLMAIQQPDHCLHVLDFYIAQRHAGIKRRILSFLISQRVERYFDAAHCLGYGGTR